jgi:hypothetical protein
MTGPAITCPVCDRPAVYDAGEDRYFHRDGTSNRRCWFALLKGWGER